MRARRDGARPMGQRLVAVERVPADPTSLRAHGAGDRPCALAPPERRRGSASTCDSLSIAFGARCGNCCEAGLVAETDGVYGPHRQRPEPRRGKCPDRHRPPSRPRRRGSGLRAASRRRRRSGARRGGRRPSVACGDPAPESWLSRAASVFGSVHSGSPATCRARSPTAVASFCRCSNHLVKVYRPATIIRLPVPLPRAAAPARRAGAAGGRVLLVAKKPSVSHFTISRSSTSNTSVAPGLMRGGAPRSP